MTGSWRMRDGRWWLLAALLLASSSLRTAADVIYSQGFDSPDTPSGNGDALGLYNWATHRSGNGAIAINGNAGWPANPVANVSSAQARVVDDAVNPPSPSDRVFLFWNADAAEDFLVWTEDFTGFDLGDYSAAEIRWHHRNTNGSGGTSEPGTRAAVALNDGALVRWFASDTLLLNTSSGDWRGEAVSLMDPVWIEFLFDGTQASDASGGFSLVGSPVSLPAGTVVGAGIYAQFQASGTSGDAIRLDSFTIQATPVPEPATLALLGLGGALAAWRRRKQA